jgi:death-on-curing protein
MKQPEWVLRAVVLALQDFLIAEFGGVAGIRDISMLDSALARPEHLFTYGSPSIPELAAAYAFGLIKNHPFVDGNKRIGFAVAATFLEVNGRKLDATEADAVIQTLALAAGEIDETDYARWLDSCCA